MCIAVSHHGVSPSPGWQEATASAKIRVRAWSGNSHPLHACPAAPIFLV